MRTTLLLLMVLALSGCGPNHTANVPTRPPARPGAHPDQTPAEQIPLALLNRDPISLLDMQARLLESAGGEIIRELRLEQALRQQLQQADMQITDAAVLAEEHRLLQELNDDQDVASRLLQSVRNAQGLGRTRYRALLWRNAALRALVQPQVEVDPQAMQRVFEIAHGPTFLIRVIVVTSLARAAQVVEQLNAGEDFSRLAIDWSIDASRDRGGLLDPLSLSDTAYPASLRQTVGNLTIGAHSNPILLGDRYLIARLEAQIPGDGLSFEVVEAKIRTRTRLAHERLLMQEEAHRLRDSSTLRVFDETLEASLIATDPERQTP